MTTFKALKAELLLLLAAVIWGSAFVAQRIGMGSSLTIALRGALMRAANRF